MVGWCGVSRKVGSGITSLSTRTSLRECEKEREVEARGQREARKKPEYIPSDRAGWVGGEGGDEPCLSRWDEEPPSPAPRTGKAEKGACCSRPSQRVAPFHNSAPFDWTWRHGGHGQAAKTTAYPHEGPLCGTSCHLLARVRCSSRAGFRSLRKNGTRHPTPAPPHRTTDWTTGHVHRTLLVVAGRPGCICQSACCVRGTTTVHGACNGDHALMLLPRTGHGGPASARARGISRQPTHERTHARTHALI